MGEYFVPADPPPHTEPIAVCGLSLKFPQDASSESGFWDMILERRSAMTEFPSDRLNIDAFHHPTRPNALRTRGAHFLKEDLGVFDANFFAITPSEASAMDPMQRMLLETTYKAFENAGIRIEDVKGSRTSVHTGCFTNDYLQQMLKDSQRLPPYAAVGGTQSMLANRLSWFYDLRGPSLNLDSACSSSAVAVDLSCQLLHSGVTDMGVVAGCNLLLDPDFSIILSNMQMLSPSGRCHTFDHRADGYSRGEGVGVVVLKRLSDALRDNDTIRAVIRASGSNQDGRTPGITQPDPKAQAQLIRETYQRAGLSMAHTRFFEAHGTGTALGDPIELSAIASCFHGHRDASDPLYVGSVKTNIGHLEGASGIAGLIKAILVVESGVIPPNANFESINRKLSAYDYMISLPSECVEWPQCDIRRASVNSFGYGGTNSHIVVDDAWSYLQGRGLVANFSKTGAAWRQRGKSVTAATTEEFPKLLVWSASAESATREMVSTWESWFSKVPERPSTPSISDLAYTLDTRRSVLPSRSFAVISGYSDLRGLSQIASSPVNAAKRIPRLAFIFTGQGAQWYAMGRELFIYPRFVESIRASETFLKRLGCSWSPHDELNKSEKESLIDQADVAQCLTAVVQIGMVDLLKSFDVSPVAVVGHSMGEIAAAYCAELLTRQSALRVAFYRGVFTATLPARSSFKGAMLAVALPAEDLPTYFEKIDPDCYSPSTLGVSCFNSPRNTTVSGEESTVEILKRILEAEGIFARRLRVPVAYHSPQMNLITSDCLANFNGLESPKQKADIKMISSVTGCVLTREVACQAGYWTTNMVSPVRFFQAMGRLVRDSESALRPKIDGRHRDAIVIDTLVEVGPHAALKLPIQETMRTLPRGDDIKYLSTLYRKQSASVTLLRLIGQLHCWGLPVNLRRVNDPQEACQKSRSCLVDAPEYPFDHSKRYWAESPLVRNYRLRTHGHVELLGSPSRDWNPLQPQWRCHVQVAEMPWLMDHKLNGRAVYPASAMIIMAVQGVSQLTTENDKVAGFTLRNIRYESPIAISPESTDLETRLHVNPIKSTAAHQPRRWDFRVYSVTAGNWIENCSGTVEIHLDTKSVAEGIRERSRFHKDCLRTRSGHCNKFSDSAAVYESFTKSGFHYGPSFQGITSLRHNGTDTVTSGLSLETASTGSAHCSGFIIHPATLDSFFHLALVTLSGQGNTIPTQAISHIDKLWISRHGLDPSHTSLRASARLEGETPRTKLYSGFATSEDNEHVRLVLRGLQTTVIACVDEKDEIAGDSQFWCGVHTAVDVDTLSGTRILRYLESICGPDPVGPTAFFLDLRKYLLSMVRESRCSIQTSGIDPNKPYLKRYVDWMDWHLNSSQNLEPPNDPLLRQRIEEYGFLGQFFLRVADNALDVLQGKSDMVQLIFEDNLVETFYEEFLVHSSYYEKLQTYLGALSFKHNSMDFLEVGAGTGSFTERILKSLSSSATGAKELFNSYCYTDISPAFFERARSRFSSYSHKMDFALLNVEQDPCTQGFKEQTFDVVAASNVLHVTNNLDRTLQGLRKLLKPGGKLLLHEYIHPERIEVGFVFGLLPGWWPEDESRKLGPLANEKTWDELLRRNGFSGADFVLRDFADQESHLMSIICATAVETHLDLALPEVAVVFESDSSIQVDMAQALTSKLSAEGRRAVQMDLSSPGEAFPGVVVTLFDLERAILSRLDEKKFKSIKSLLLSSSTTLWVSKGGASADPSHGMMDGFARVFRIENINSKLATLALDKNSVSPEDDCSLISSALKQMSQPIGREFAHPENYVVQDGALCLRRVYETKSFKSAVSGVLSGSTSLIKPVKDAKPFGVTFQNTKSSTSPRITEDSSSLEPLGPDEVEIQVQAFGLNPIDFSVISGKSSAIKIGRECAGIVSRVGSRCALVVGDHVCAYGNDVLRSTSRVNRKLVARVPKALPFAEASTIPQDYVMANYLIQETRVHRGDMVLVIGGDTRLGRATLDALKKYGPMLCTTVCSIGKDEIFFDGITVLTESFFPESFRSYFPSGANVVLDFMYSDILKLTECVSKFGNLISVRTTGDISASINKIELPTSVGFKTVDVEEVLSHQVDTLEMPFSEFTQTSAHRPFPMKTIDLSSLEEITAFTKTLEPEQRIAVTYEHDSQIQIHQEVASRPLFDPCYSYVISGGVGDLGRCIAKWMADRGARNLVLLSRSGPHTESAKSTIRVLEQMGVRVCTPTCDVADRSSLQSVLEQLRDMPPIKGCIQTAGALKDVMYERMSFDDWQVAVKPKTQGSWNLHELLPKGMDFFILASSISGIMGQATQINYAAGNTYQDALAGYRLSIGEKAVSLDLGILATGGLVSQNKGLAERLAAENVYTVLSEPEILALFEYFCDARLRVDEMPAQIVSGFINPSQQDARSSNFPPAFSHPFWSHTLSRSGSEEKSKQATSGGIIDLGRSMAEADCPAKMSEIVAAALADQISSLVMIPLSNVNMEEPLHTAGADSLSAVYLRNWIMKQFAVDVAVFDILGDMSILALGNLITREWLNARDTK